MTKCGADSYKRKSKLDMLFGVQSGCFCKLFILQSSRSDRLHLTRLCSCSSVHRAAVSRPQSGDHQIQPLMFVFMFCVAHCDSRTVLQSGSTALWKYFLCRVWRGIHMGFDLVMKEGCEGNNRVTW